MLRRRYIEDVDVGVLCKGGAGGNKNAKTGNLMGMREGECKCK